jgi:hypothetical protein
MPYTHFTEEQKLRAASVDLEEFLRYHGEEFTRSGPELRLKSDHSITIRDNEWYDHAIKRGGGPISFVQNFYNMGYPEAMALLLGGEQGQAYPQAREKVKEPSKVFELPPKHSDMRRVYAYLIKQRRIDRTVIAHFAKAGSLYEDAEYHNCVFIGTDENGIPRHAHKRSTNTYGKSFRINVEGSLPQYSFHHIGTDDKLYVFEAPIDMLSYITLHPENWQSHSYVSLCGTGDKALLWMLENLPQVREVFLCLDHDEAGIEAGLKHREALHELGHGQVKIIQPKYKDWNENLKARHGLSALPGEEHPQLLLAGPICQRVTEKGTALQGGDPAKQIPALLEQYRIHLRLGHFEQAMSCMESAAGLALSAAVRAFRQTGREFTPAEWSNALYKRIMPHKNRDSLQGRDKKLATDLQAVLAKCTGATTEADHFKDAAAWMDFAVSCTMAPIRYEADILKEQQKQQKGQSQPPPEMVGMAMAPAPA